jgi:uncharacterized delta-60 repeat protein
MAFLLILSVLFPTTVRPQFAPSSNAVNYHAFGAAAAGRPITASTAYVVLDASFGGVGFRTEAFGSQRSLASAMVLQPDGKIVVAGTANFGAFGLMRFNADGSLDTSFDGDGKVTTQLSSAGSEATSLVALPDGKLLAGGISRASNGTGQFALVRYNANGSIDTSFGSGGIVTTLVGPRSASLFALAVRPDGRILAGGTATNEQLNGDFALVSYNADGSLDTTFDGDGKLTTEFFTGSDDVVNAIALMSDGKVVAGGSAFRPGYDCVLARYNSDGSLDTSFDGDGKVVTDISPTGLNAVNALAVQPDGKIVAAGPATNRNIGNNEAAVVRYNVDGSLDNSFAGDGIATIGLPLAEQDTVYSRTLHLLPGGRILYAGRASRTLAVFRINSDGSLDKSFDRDGRASAILKDFSQVSASDLALDAQGRIVTAGTFRTFSAASERFGVARFEIGVETPLANPFDLSGDGRADLTVFRPSNITWYTQSSTGFALREFGAPGDRITPADFDKDGITDIAVFRPSTGVWYILGSAEQTFNTIPFGENGDLPVVSDLTGDGAAELALFRPSDSSWRITSMKNVLPLHEVVFFGSSGDLPVTGDFDGDGADDIAVYRPADNIWQVRKLGGVVSFVAWGQAGDLRVPADYDGDGRSDVAVYRPSEGMWYLLNSTEGMYFRHFGENGDVPIPSAYSY